MSVGSVYSVRGTKHKLQLHVHLVIFACCKYECEYGVSDCIAVVLAGGAQKTRRRASLHTLLIATPQFVATTIYLNSVHFDDLKRFCNLLLKALTLRLIFRPHQMKHFWGGNNQFHSQKEFIVVIKSIGCRQNLKKFLNRVESLKVNFIFQIYSPSLSPTHLILSFENDVLPESSVGAADLLAKFLDYCKHTRGAQRDGAWQHHHCDRHPKQRARVWRALGGG